MCVLVSINIFLVKIDILQCKFKKQPLVSQVCTIRNTLKTKVLQYQNVMYTRYLATYARKWTTYADY